MNQRAGTALQVAGALALGLILWYSRRSAPRSAPLGTAALGTERWSLSPQDCNTQCQSQQTDCVLNCDGAANCERACLDVGRACAERCLRAAIDAGAPPPDPGRGPRRGNAPGRP